MFRTTAPAALMFGFYGRTDEPCKPADAPAPSGDAKRYSVCEKAALQKSYKTQVKMSHPAPDFRDQQRLWSACPQRDDKVGLPPYVAPDRPLSGIPVRAATDCVYPVSYTHLTLPTILRV